MIKVLMSFLLFVLFPNFSFALEKPVFLCLTASQSFEIKLNPKTRLLEGALYSSSKRKLLLHCGETKAGYSCKKNDYLIKVFKAPSGRMTVQASLDGDFGFESGYLYSLNCR